MIRACPSSCFIANCNIDAVKLLPSCALMSSCRRPTQSILLILTKADAKIAAKIARKRNNHVFVPFLVSDHFDATQFHSNTYVTSP
jgi:hypothetical protein